MTQMTQNKVIAQNVQNVQNVQDIEDSSSANRERVLDTKTGKVSRGKHPNSLKNLNQFEKGVSGNPSGRPSKEDKLRSVLNEIGGMQANGYDVDMLHDFTFREEVCREIWKKAKYGDWNCIKLLKDLGCLTDNK